MEAKFEDVPDEVWKYVEPWLPAAPSHARGGRSRVDDRRALAGIVYRLKTGCQWKATRRNSAAARRFIAASKSGRRPASSTSSSPRWSTTTTTAWASI